MTAPVEAGRRDVLVTVQQLTESAGASGFPVQTWTTLTTVWMGRVAASARERFAANQTTAWADTKWYCAWRSELDPDTVPVTKTLRLVHEGRVHDIVAASAIGRRYAIEFTTLAKVDQP